MSTLKELLESSVLTDEVKSELTEAFEAQVQKAVSDKEVELAEQFEATKAQLAKDTIEMIEEAVAEEFSTIQEEITEARSLDIRYAIKLEEFKEQYAQAKSAELEEMAREEIRKEMDELRESLEEARKNIAGKRMFEAFQESYADLVHGGDSEGIKEELKEAKEELETLRREKKINELLEGVTGRKRRVMLTLIENVATDKLEDRVSELTESVLLKDEGEGNDLSESEEIPNGSRVVLEEGAKDDEAQKKAQSDWLKRVRRQAGLED